MIGVREVESTSPKVGAKNEGVYALDHVAEYTLAEGSKLREALGTALVSPTREDSEVQIIVQTVDRSG